ncbi:MAG: hypothetical protein PHF24_06365 [Syntrophomonas sp.]|nr:hypothetical protein [Syntrophomonas sp.]
MLANHINKPANTLDCPRSAADVYYFGMYVHDYLDNIYRNLKLASRPNQDNRKQFDASRNTCKDEIRTLIENYLNRCLGYFYKNGGPVIQAPVSDTDIQEIQPFFYKIAANFYDQLETMSYIASKGDMSANDLKVESTKYIIGLLNTMEKLYSVDEVKEAFEDLITVEKNLLQ